MTHFSCKAMPTNNTDYNCHLKVVELVNQSYRVHVMPLSVSVDTHIHIADKINRSIIIMQP